MNTLQTAILAGGCFWCLEAVYQEVQGVLQVESGYIGGHVADPTYEAVCTGTTGHAEAVRVTYDPARVSFRQLLEVFFVIHDPTQRNRQGHDVGTQYRSAIFWLDEQQEAEARHLLKDMTDEGVFGEPIVTELVPAGTFYLAELYHHDYYRQHSSQPYCAHVVAPKLEKFRYTLARLAR